VNDLSEKEQLEEMRAWWSENGRFVMGGVVLGVAIIFGWNQWRASIEATQLEASNLFEEVMTAVGNGDADAAELAADYLFENYQQTVYPDQTRLAMARLYMDKGRDQDAVEVLRGLIVEGEETEIQLLGRLRLAKVLLFQNKPDEVVELLKDRGESGFTARYSEVLGDAYVAQGNYAEAQTAYLLALGEQPALQTIDNNLVQLKLNDLPDLDELAETSAAIEAAIDEGEVADEPEDSGEAVEAPAEPQAEDGPETDGETEK
jgi:predicted negative regulator of RcsB-dependent stress response